MITGGVSVLGSAGARYISGTVSIDGVAASRRVVAFDRRDLSYLGSTHAGADGVWRIPHLPDLDIGQILCVSVDDSGVFNAEAADFITAVEE